MTNTDICNLALSYIKKRRIVSFDEATEEARQVKIYYDHIRRSLLRKAPWGFARKVVSLALLDETLPLWRYVYKYPAQCVFVRYVFSEDTAGERRRERRNFEVALIGAEVKVIGSDESRAYAEFMYDVKDADLFSEDFIAAFSHLLASSLAVPLAGSGQLEQTQFQLYQLALAEARTADAREREEAPVYPDKYRRAR
jgi:hypothetical protein